MVVFRGLLIVGLSCILFAAGGGLIAIGLNWFAPGYYAGVFPNYRGDNPAQIGIAIGIFQGLFVGALVGAVVALSLGWFGQLETAPSARAFAVVCFTGLVFSIAGTLLGYCIGTFAPDYYRSVVSGGRLPYFNPRDVGIGLGCTQGLIVGLIAGALAIVFLAWRRWRAANPGAGLIALLPVALEAFSSHDSNGAITSAALLPGRQPWSE
jgi:hypothetical protein